MSPSSGGTADPSPPASSPSGGGSFCLNAACARACPPVSCSIHPAHRRSLSAYREPVLRVPGAQLLWAASWEKVSKA